MSLRISDRNESCTYLVDISPVSCCWPKFKHELFFLLRNGPVKNDSNNGNEHVGMQKTFLLSVLTSDWLKQQKFWVRENSIFLFRTRKSC